MPRFDAYPVSGNLQPNDKILKWDEATGTVKQVEADTIAEDVAALIPGVIIGDQGPQGPQGFQGDAGGPQGPQGVQGADGPQGVQGPAGPQGAVGATGLTGPQGVDGPAGPQGVQGPDGATGSTGPQGVQGPTGATGGTGSQGPQGVDGATGPQGTQGPFGPAGPQGPQGAAGGVSLSAENVFTGRNTFTLYPKTTRTDLGSGTSLAVGVAYYNAIGSNKTVAFVGTPASGDRISLYATANADLTLGIPSSIRAGDSSASITSVSLENGKSYLLDWEYINSQWILTFSQASGQGSRLVESVSQTGHGFTAGQIVTKGASGYVLARADSGTTAGAVGMVLSPTTDAFLLLLEGFLPSGEAPGGLSANTDYVLSPSTAGAYMTNAAFVALPPATTDFKTFLFSVDDDGNVIFSPETPVALSLIQPSDIDLVALAAELEAPTLPATASDVELEAGSETALRSYSPKLLGDWLTAALSEIQVDGASTGDIKLRAVSLGVESGWSLLGVNGFAALSSPDAAYQYVGKLGGVVADPVFSVPPGEVEDDSTVELSCETPSATIRYTTGDGSQAAPTRDTGTVYSGPITITDDVTIKAIAYLDFWADSQVSSATYQVAAGVTNLVAERFEGVGQPDADWTAEDSGIDYDWTTAPAPLVGTESLRVTGSFKGCRRVLGASYSELWACLAINAGASSNSPVIAFGDSVGIIAQVSFRSDRLRINVGASSVDLIGAVHAQNNRIWLRYVAQSGGGGNGIFAIYINKNSLSTTRPALSGSTGTQITTHSGGPVDRLSLYAQGAGDWIFDDVIVRETEIIDNPFGD